MKLLTGWFAAPRALATRRDLRLDFFRGLALIFIFVDHIPNNFLSYFTLQSIGFYDAAEVFIFISGFTAALVYGRMMDTRGKLYSIARVLRRAWQLYVAHIFLFMIFVAEVSYTAAAFNNSMYTDEMRIADFLREPHVAIVEALLLRFQPAFLDILPLYIVLLLIFPLVLLGLRWRPWVVLVPSLLAYLAVQIFDISVPTYPQGHVWFFNPLAWQFLFVAGAALGLAATRGRRFVRVERILFPAAAAIFIAATIIKLSWTLHWSGAPVPALLVKALWPVSKGDLAPLRLVPFFALVLLVAVLVRPDAAFLRIPAARPLILCGQQSLEVFCLGIILSALGHFALSEYDGGVAAQLAVDAAGISAMCLTAKLIDWYKAMDRAADPPRPVVQQAPTGDGGC